MKPIALEIELADAPEVLDRARTLLTPDDHAYLTGAIHAMVALLRLAHERGATISRIRRVFHLHSSEKLAALFPATASLGPSQPAEPAEPRASSGDATVPSETNECASATAAPSTEQAPDADRAAWRQAQPCVRVWRPAPPGEAHHRAPRRAPA